MKPDTRLTKKETQYFLDALWIASSVAIIEILEKRRRKQAGEKK